MNASPVAELHARCRATADLFLEEHAAEIEAYRDDIRRGIDEALDQIRADIDGLSGGSEIVLRLGEEVAGYVSWMQWALWDLPVLALASVPDHDEFRDAVAACGLVYISIRLFDDVIDEHHAYKGRRATVLGSLTAGHSDAGAARALSTLAGLLVCFEGLARLAGEDPVSRRRLATVLASVRNAVVGATMEYTDLDGWDPGSYERMVRLKNVDYWRSLYAALDPGADTPLEPFLSEYYAIAQYLNDVQDYEADLRRGQPNALSVGRRDAPLTPRFAEVERHLADRYLALGARLDDLPPRERAVAETELAASLDGALKLGLFSAPEAPVPPPPPAEVRLFWYSHLDNVIEELGTGALVDVGCAVCGAGERHPLFTKQGFRYHRCDGCGHVSVSPRVTAEAQERMLADLDDAGFEDRYLEVQRMYAEITCSLLARKAEGPRLLDIGFGRGYVLQMAQAHGFEVHGIDASAGHVAAVAPFLGDRVAHRLFGRDPLPWDSLDVVVMTHVLEHLPEPAQALAEVRAALNPGGWLYLAVPDMDSVDYRIFGKRWDVVNPLAHLQYFTDGSLRHLLEESGFEAVERVRHPRIRDEISPRWMRLMRQLGGDELGELTFLAKSPGEET